MLTAAGLLAGANLTATIEIPASLLARGAQQEQSTGNSVRLKPLTVHDLQLIVRAARDNDELSAALMVQRSLIEPELTLAQVAQLPIGLMQFLLREVNRLSGMAASEAEIAATIADPLAQASFRLSQAFGWTPEDIGKLTLGEVLTHLQFLKTA